MFDMMKMMGKIKEAQEKIQEAQKALTKLEITAESGAGMVKATVNGKKQLIDLDIDNSLVKPGDEDMLKDLIIAAVNKAIEDADELAKEEIKKSTEGIIPNIPGMNLGGLF
ncbi:YbaB/EbfC family nucleoid-associated protein [Fulvivirgaceae bacterium BMA12]|uniref:Nucleoid-associated protein QQ020_19815 n=1 Tax=Agaribacillus aureus TaxID=3051825 RepID=A0ABT8LAS9_9BACT|nr:YbaB/EbfC family nucleoid-associated protein [Fulvivirgaceae bacterium BMA12]